MLISVISDIEKFHQLKVDWEQVHQADQNAQIFLSWSWLCGYLQYNPQNWFILALQSSPNSPYIGFFPLGIRSLKWNGVNLYQVLHMAGEPLADYTGFICLPEYEEAAISAFATYIQEKLEWDYFHLKEVIDPRVEALLQHFSPEKFDLQPNQGASCSYICLPASWEEYLQQFLGSKSRKNLRSALRKIESDRNLRLEETHHQNFETQLDALLTLMQMQRGTQPENLLQMYREIFRRVAEKNNLWLSILWDKDKPVAGTGIFVDSQRGKIYGYMTGYNSQYAKLSPGRVMMAYSIQKAIDNQIEIYDFLRGSEAYKCSFFGTTARYNTDFSINRKNLRTIGMKMMKQVQPLRNLIMPYVKPL